MDSDSLQQFRMVARANPGPMLVCFLLKSTLGMGNSRAAAQTLSFAPKPRCLGREGELNRLLTCFEQAVGGTSTFVLVTGGSGVGKSTFLGDVQRHLLDAGALVLEARCRPGLPSFRPLLDVVRGALEHLYESGDSDALGSTPADLLDVLGGRAAAPAGDPATHRWSFFDQMAELLRAVSAVRPTVVLVHDLDLADPATAQFVRYLGRVLAAPPELADQARFRGLLIAGARSAASIAPDGWADATNLVTIDLGGLDAAGVRAFLASDEVVQRVLKSTGGVPRLLDVLITQGLTQARDVTPLTGVGAAETRLLRVMAVFGRPLGPETLRLLTGLPHDRLARSIAALSERHLIEKTVVEGELRLGFVRAGDQRTVYDGMEAAERRLLHAEAGAYLEGLGESELESCAQHLLLAEAGAKAVRLALQAGQRLEIAFCFERAAELYEQALTQAEEPVRGELLEKLGTSCELLGKLDRALEVAELLRQRAPEEPAAALRIAHLHRVRGDFASARSELDRLQERLGQQPEARAVMARVLAELADVQHLAGEADLARSSAVSGILLCSAADEHEELTGVRMSIQNTLARIHLEREELEPARMHFASNLELARSMGQRSWEVQALYGLGLVEMVRAQYAEAERWYGEARHLAEAVGDLRLLGGCLQNLGVLAERRGDFRGALEHYQEAVGVWKRVGHRSFLAWVGLDLGKLYLKLGDVARASAMAELATKLADAEPPLATRINLESLRGLIAQRECRYTEAAERIGRARQLAAEGGQAERETRCLLELASVHLDRGAPEEALRLLREEVGLPRQEALRLQALLQLGHAESQTGEHQAAAVHLSEALELSDSLPDPELGWQARFALALVARHQGRPSEARRLLAEASIAEERVRSFVPEEFWSLLADQPTRLALRQAVEGEFGGSGALPRATSAVEERPRRAQGRTRFGGIVGGHRKMQQVYDHIEKIATSEATVLIRGESGTGKELIAEAIHRRSARASKPLIKVNCGALVESLLLSELFGHERGAFTGAMQRKKGRFELADGGTIFLDEIGDVSPKTQVALLRVLQEREFERVGGVSPIHIDVRIICATNRDLEAMVARGEFREDLYYRLNGVRLEVPPLRDRGEDLPLLADNVLERIAQERGTPRKQLTLAAERLLCAYAWPGNVRELENVLRSASLFAESDVLDVGDFADYAELAAAKEQEAGEELAPPRDCAPASAEGVGAYSQVRALGWSLKEYKKRIEVECITAALSEAAGNITRAAELLGMKRPRLSQLIKEHGIELP
jgi:DNA-binding NtrC family response regulator/tetratricopeptide (TPR) repeat protein